MVKQHYSDIDGLRGVAVSLVVVNHLSSELIPHGYLGVDLFFVISGFVIAQVLFLNLEFGLSEFLLNFYAARLKRLLPVLLLVILASSIAISLFAPSPNSFLKTGIFAIFGLANILLYLQSQDYFSHAAELNPFTHMWSLGVEEQFYFLLPLFLWLAVRLKSFRFFHYILCAIVAFSAVLFVTLYPHDQQFSFYMMPARFWELGLGVLVYLAAVRAQRSSWSNLIGTFSNFFKGAFFIAIICIAFLPASSLGPYPSLFVGIASAAIVFLIAISSRNSLFLSSVPLTHIGKLSYSIYLWHWPVIVILRWTYGLTLPLALWAILLIYALSFLSHRYVETTLRYSDWSVTRHREIALALVTSCVVALGIIVQVKLVRADLYLGEPISGEHLGVSSLTYEYRTAEGTIWHGDNCVLSSNSDVGAAINLNNCIVGAPPTSADCRVLVMGNSFSAALVPMFNLVELSGNRFSFFVTSSWGAAPVLGMPHDGEWDLASAYYWNDLFPRFIEGLGAGDSLFLASDLAGFSPPAFNNEAAERLEALRDHLTELSLLLKERGINLLVFGPLPFLREAECDPIAASKQWFAPNGAACNYLSRDETLQRQAPLRKILRDLERSGVIRQVDAFEIFCGVDKCKYFSDKGVLLYRDEWSHPSYEAAILARESLLHALR